MYNVLPVKPGTAARLGLRKPPYGHYRQRWMLGITVDDIEECVRDNPHLRALREVSRVDWPTPIPPQPEVVWVEGFRS